MSRLTVKLLGPPEVTYQDHSLKFRSRKVLALFVYLLVEEELQSREKLAALLWPDSSHERGMASLRNTLARLRQSLSPAGQFLLTMQGMVGFDFTQDIDLDLRVLETAVQPNAAEDILIAALTLHRGPFMSGLNLPDAPEFEDWLIQQRTFWEQRWETIFANLSRRQLAEGKSHAAIETATRWLAETQYNETAYQCLMKAYTLAGDRAAALRIYDQCRQVFETELGITPAPVTVELAGRIANEPQLSSGSSHSLVLPQTFVNSSTERLVIPFVGRKSEQKRLRASYFRSLQNDTQVVAVIGEAGQGKTQLVETFLTWATLENRGADVLRGRAFEMGGHLPYQPLIDALRVRLDQENAPDDLMEDVWLSELSQFLPELRGRYPDLAPPMSGNAEFVRGRLFEAVALLGLALAKKRPLILFIDDMQWADSGTQEMLHYLVQRWTAVDKPIIILLTMRQEGLLTQPALRDWLTSLGRDTDLIQLELAPLIQSDLQQLFSHWTEGDNDSDAAYQLASWLKRETNGSPFFVSELLQMLVEQEILTGEQRDDGRFLPDLAATLQNIEAIDRVPLPPNVRDVILARLNRLSEKARNMLLAGAVIGRECSFERLCQVAGLDRFAGLPVLEELLIARLMLETGNQDRPFTFAHDNIRDVTYTEAGSTRRRLFHHQLFSMLQQGPTSAAELAFHAIAARLNEDAFRYSLAAGDEALKLNAFVEAVNQYNRALDHAEQVDYSSEQLCALYSQRGRALELCGHYVSALENYQTMISLAWQHEDQTLELAALVAEGTIRATANELSDFVLGEELGEQGLALAHIMDDKAAEARIQWNMLNIYRMTNRNEHALAAGNRALTLAEELDLREVMAYAANDLGYIYMAQGDVASILAMGEKAIALWRELGNQPMLTDSLINFANMQVMKGSYETALEIAAEALQISHALENQWAHSYSLYTYSMVYKQRMVVDQAIEVMEESVRLAEAVGFTGAQVLVRVFQAQLRLALGDVVKARELVQTAVDISKSSIPLFLAASQGVLAQIALYEGNPAGAEAVLEVGGLKKPPFSLMNFLTPETAVCCLALETGKFEDAYLFSAQVLEHLVGQNLLMYMPDFLYFQGQALVGMNRPHEARMVLCDAMDILRETGSRWYFLEIAALLVGLEEQAGQMENAEALIQEARAVRDHIAMHIPEGALRSKFISLSAA